MDNQLILVADADPKNLQILKDNLEASGFMVVKVSNGKNAFEEIQQSPPTLILTEINLPDLSGFQLLERLKADPKTSSIPLIFLTKQREIQQRVRAFELGAKDYLVKPLHVKEVIAHIRMVLRRLEQRKPEQNDTHKRFSGRLNQFTLSDLIENFGVERKTGILTISNGRRTGQVFFREGSVINANLGDFKKEHAIYQMIPWNRGYFNMIFRDVDIADEISISNLGLLLQGIKRLEIRKKLISQFPVSDTGFHMTPSFKKLMNKNKTGADVHEFTKLLDGEHSVEQIIDECKLDDLVALKRLVRLYNQGFIEPTVQPKKPEPAYAESIEPEKKVEYIKKPFIPEDDHFDSKVFEQPIQEPVIDDQIPGAEEPDLNIEEITSRHQESDRLDEETIEHTSEPELSEKPEEDNFATDITADKKTEEVPTDELDEESVFKLVPEEDDAPPADVIKQSTAAEDAIETSDETLRDKSTDDQQPEFSEDEIFKIKPLSKKDELEKEIKPLIESIDKENQKPPQQKDQKPVERKPKPEPEGAPKEKSVELTKKPVDEDKEVKVYIDEELIDEIANAISKKEAEKVEHLAESEQMISAEKQEDRITDGEHRDKLVLISIDDDNKDELMDILTNDNFKTSKIEQADNFQIDYGKIHINGYPQYNIIALSVEKHLNPVLESLKREIRGFIFTFDCTRPDTWEYTSYLIHSIYDKFKIPFVIAVFNFDEEQSLKQEVIRYKLHLDEDKNMVLWNESDKSSIPSLLSSLNNSTHHAEEKQSKEHDPQTEKATL